MPSKKEQFFSIGFFEDKNKILSFCLTPQISDKIFFTASKKDSIHNFDKTKKKIGIKYLSKKDILIFTDEDSLSIANFKKEKIISVFNKKNKTGKLILFQSKNLTNLDFKTSVPGIKENGVIVPDTKYKDGFILLYGEKNIKIAFSKDLKKWVKPKEPVLKARPAFFDKGNIKVIGSQKIDRGILVFYDSSVKENGSFKIQIGAAILSEVNPQNIIWRSNSPIFEQQTRETTLQCKGIISKDNQIFTYWVSALNKILVFPFYNQFSGGPSKKHLERHYKNPIISPEDKDWNASGTFNPTAVDLEGSIHLVYRAIGRDGVSKFGYARTKDGIHIEEHEPKPIFAMKEPRLGMPDAEKRYDFVMYPSGGSWGGAEDPRLSKIDERIYMTFNSFENWDSIRVGLTSISEKDFKNKKWNWTEPIMISPKKEVNKNWVLFPEKIGGKFAVLHSISPNVQIEYIDDFEELSKEKRKIESKWVKDGGPKHGWDTYLRGVGPAPVKTKNGWLVFYHATNKISGYGYAMGAMLLDLKNPEKIIARSSTPILLPHMWYENDWKPGVVYACGSVIKDGMIYVYYGGGDKYVCVATAELNNFLKDLKEKKQINFAVKNASFS